MTTEVRDTKGNIVPDDAFIVRHTEVSQFRQCRRNWYVHSQHGMNLEPLPRLESRKLRFGKMWHEAMEHYFKNGCQDEALRQGWEDAYAQEWAEMGLDHADDDELKEKVHKEQALGVGMIQAYLDWQNSPGCEPPLDKDLEIVDTELRVVVPLDHTTVTGRPCYLAVKWDAVALWRTDPYKKPLWVMEHKSASKSTRVDIPTYLPLDLQASLQLLAANIVYVPKRYDVYGVLHTTTRKQAPSSRVKNPIVARHPVYRGPRELRRVQFELHHAIDLMVQTQENPSTYCYPNPQPYGGYCTWGCKVAPVCVAITKGENAKVLLESNYRRREKNIMEVLAEETSTEDN